MKARLSLGCQDGHDHHCSQELPSFLGVNQFSPKKNLLQIRTSSTFEGLASSLISPKLKWFQMSARPPHERQDGQDHHCSQELLSFLAVNLFSPKLKSSQSVDIIHTRGLSCEPKLKQFRMRAQP